MGSRNSSKQSFISSPNKTTLSHSSRVNIFNNNDKNSIFYDKNSDIKNTNSSNEIFDNHRTHIRRRSNSDTVTLSSQRGLLKTNPSAENLSFNHSFKHENIPEKGPMSSANSPSSYVPMDSSSILPPLSGWGKAGLGGTVSVPTLPLPRMPSSPSIISFQKTLSSSSIPTRQSMQSFNHDQSSWGMGSGGNGPAGPKGILANDIQPDSIATYAPLKLGIL
jgi:hypothetical protein